jgi:hypothetical protein
VLAIPVFAADGNQTWSGKVDFWESTVANRVKENTNKKCYNKFSGSPYNYAIYVHFTQKNDVDQGIVCVKTKFKHGDEKNLNTSAVENQSINLRAAREYWLDTKVQLSGIWNP